MDKLRRTPKDTSPKKEKRRPAKKAGPPPIGRLMRDRRRRLNLTLQDVSKVAGVSVGFLSQVERNMASPSLSSLVSICRALDVGIEYFLTPPQNNGLLTKASSRKFFSLGNKKVKYSRLNQEFPGGQLTAVISHIEPGFVSEEVSHEGEEFIYVISGTAFVRVGDETYDLSPGDSMHFQSSIPHQWGNSDSECVLLIMGTAPWRVSPKNDP